LRLWLVGIEPECHGARGGVTKTLRPGLHLADPVDRVLRLHLGRGQGDGCAALGGIWRCILIDRAPRFDNQSVRTFARWGRAAWRFRQWHEPDRQGEKLGIRARLRAVDAYGKKVNGHCMAEQDDCENKRAPRISHGRRLPECRSLEWMDH